MPLGWSLVTVPFLIALNAFFVAAEYAVVALREPQMDAMQARGKKAAAAASRRLKEDPASAIGAIQVCITMTNLMLGWIGEPAMSTLLGKLFTPVQELAPAVMAVVSTALSFLVVTLLTVVLSELLPKALTLRYVESVAALTAVPILLVQRAIWPLVWLMNAMANAITRPLGLGSVADVEEERVTINQLALLARHAAEQGVLSQPERSLVLNSLVIGDRTAKQVMVPRVKVAYLDLRRSMDQNLRAMNEHLYTRMPLCDGGMDCVVGVVPTKEFLAAYQARGDVSVLSLLAHKPVFVPENLPLDRLLGVFRQNRTQLVFLVDEFGGLEGIVTLQDVVDELVGEIDEARAQLERPADVSPAADGHLIVPGDMPLHELARRIERPGWASGATADTVGGAVVERIGHFPVGGEETEIDGVHLRIVDGDGKVARRVYVRPIQPLTSEGRVPSVQP